MMTDRSMLAVFFAVLVALKVYFLISLGPVFLPDSSDYMTLAERMTADGTWLHENDLGTYWLPPLSFRILGYPAVIALFKIIAANDWAWALVAFQMGVSLIATYHLWRLAGRLTGKPVISLIAAAGHATAQGLVLDQCILTDSLNASLIIIVASRLGICALERRMPSLPAIAGLGLLVAATVLIREAGATLQYGLWPLIAIAAASAGTSIRRGILVLLVFALPSFAALQAYKAWNEYRTGERFLTTGAQTSIFRPALELHRLGLPVFANDENLHDTPGLFGREFTAAADAYHLINKHLVETHGFTVLEVRDYAYAMFVRNWLAYPLGSARVFAAELKREMPYALLRPLQSWEQINVWGGGQSPFPAPGQFWTNLTEDYRIDQGVLLALRTLFRIASVVLLVSFAVALPVICLRRLIIRDGENTRVDTNTALLMTYWLFANLYLFAYGLTHLDLRYLLPVTPFMLLGGLTAAAQIAGRLNGHSIRTDITSQDLSMPRGDETPFTIITGCPRSGTTLLANELMRRYGVSVPYETHFIPIFQSWIWLYGDLSKPHRREILLADIYAFTRIWLRASKTFDQDKIAQASILVTETEAAAIVAQSHDYPSLLRALYRHFALLTGSPAAADKSTFFSPVAAEKMVHSLGPIRVVFLVRDGRDVFMSSSKTWFGTRNVTLAARMWRRHIEQRKDWDAHPHIQSMSIRYEDLVDAPERELAEVARFLGLSPRTGTAPRFLADAMSTAPEHARLGEHIGAESVNRHKEGLSAWQSAAFSWIAGKSLRDLNYTDVTQGGFPPVRALVWFVIGLVPAPGRVLKTLLPLIFRLGGRIILDRLGSHAIRR